MNKFFFSLIFIFVVCVSSTAQVYKFKSTGYSFSDKKQNKWSAWSAFTTAEMMINFDTSKNRFVVYSQDVQLFNIITYESQKETEDDITYKFICTDSEGIPCGITLVTRKTQGHRRQLYINYPKKIIVYNMYLLSDKKEADTNNKKETDTTVK